MKSICVGKPGKTDLLLTFDPDCFCTGSQTDMKENVKVYVCDLIY